MAIASSRQPNARVRDRLEQLWAWLTRCAADGCRERPVHLGWCDLHAPAHDPEPDEYWGGPESGQRTV